MVAKPIMVSGIAKDYFFTKARKYLLMSATLNKEVMIRSMGLDSDLVQFFDIPSTFNVENRRIYLNYAGNLSKKYFDKNSMNLVRKVAALLRVHKNEKGLIHTHTYRIRDIIMKNINKFGGDEVINRMITHNSINRDNIYDDFVNSNGNQVLISPSFTEGIDLHDDLARFIIICKVPYPFLGDKQIRIRMRRDQKWYIWQTISSIIQMIGRGVRHEKDYCKTYILDSTFSRLFSMNKDMFPEHIRDAIEEMDVSMLY